jgi:N-acetylglucosaminyldiphosphoundecaprenol N-acetyl-beta-D-mannosaminyltransferase
MEAVEVSSAGAAATNWSWAAGHFQNNEGWGGAEGGDYPSGTAAPRRSEPVMPSTVSIAAEPSAGAWPIAILGVSFDPMTLGSAVGRIEAMIDARRPRYVVTPNVDFLVQARHDSELRLILAQADLVLCDGKPLVWASAWLGNALPGRVAGSDLIPLLLARAEERGWRVFLLGGAPGVGAQAARRIGAAHPLLPEVRHYSPPLGPLSAMNHLEIAARVRAAKPDIMLVCFGCPKQEKWIFQHYRDIGIPVMIGAGGAVDFLAGRLKRAPKWMRSTGSEWAFRLWLEPRRLFRRYAGDLIRFLPALSAQLWRLPGRSHGGPAPQSAPSSAPTSYGIAVRPAGHFHREALDRSAGFWAQTREQRGHCLIDLAAITSIDSTGLAFLAHWQRQLAQSNRNLILLRPSAPVRSALSQMRLTDQFVISGGASLRTGAPPCT